MRMTKALKKLKGLLDEQQLEMDVEIEIKSMRLPGIAMVVPTFNVDCFNGYMNKEALAISFECMMAKKSNKVLVFEGKVSDKQYETLVQWLDYKYGISRDNVDLFVLLHELGHYAQAKEIGDEEFDKLTAEEDKRKESSMEEQLLNREAYASEVYADKYALSIIKLLGL